MKYRLKWFRYLVFRRHHQKVTPRATWAQLLTLLSVDSRSIDTSHLVSAECIPSILDVPAQKVELTDLGIFAFCLGFNKVEISIQDRTILATGKVGTITTESLPGFGTVVRFQILTPWPQHFVAVYESKFAMEYYKTQMLGSFIFGSERRRGTWPIRYSWLRRHLDSDGTALDARCSTVDEEATEWLGLGEIFQEKANSKASETWETDQFSDYLRTWQARQNDERAGVTRRWPTILLAASIACLPATTTGFPSSAFLRPFLQVFQHMTRSLSYSTFASWDDLDDLGEQAIVLKLLQGDFCHISGHNDLVDQDRFENSSWMSTRLDLINLARVERILQNPFTIYSDTGDFWSRKLQRRKHWYGRQGVANVHPNKTSQNQATVTSGLSDHSPSLLEGHFLPSTAELLRSFDPVSWATAMRSQNRLKREPGQEKEGWRNHMRPENVLWTQVYLLDMAISKILCQCVELKPNVPKAIGKVLVDCWEDPKADAPLQCLDKFLSQKVFSEKGTEEQIEQMRALADMIKVRMLCYIAYMMVIPDSTSLYEASLQGPVMLPMI